VLMGGMSSSQVEPTCYAQLSVPNKPLRRPLNISSTVNQPSQSTSDELPSGVMDADVVERCQSIPDLALDTLDDPEDAATSKLAKWDSNAIQRLKNRSGQGSAHSQIIDSGDKEQENRAAPRLQHEMTQSIARQRRLANLPSSISIISSSPSLPVDQSTSSPRSLRGINSRGWHAQRDESPRPHDPRSSPCQHDHKAEHPNRLFIEDLLSDEMELGDMACSDNESIITEIDEASPPLSHPDARLSIKAIAMSESIIDDDDVHIANGAGVVGDPRGDCRIDTGPHTGTRVNNRVGRCSSSIIDSASEAEDDSEIRKRRSGFYERSKHGGSEQSPSGSSGLHPRSTVPALQNTETNGQKTASDRRSAMPHLRSLPVFANLSPDDYLGSYLGEGTAALCPRAHEESRRSFESIISESSVMSGVMED
jgi:hypothetical protein